MSDGSNWGQPPAETAPATPAPTGPKWYGKKWVQLLGAGLLGLVIGSASAGGTEAAKGPSQADLDAANARASQLQTEATTAKDAAQQEVAAEKARLAAAQAALDAREKKVSTVEAAAKANQFDGSDGTYLVGADIKPGTYRGTPSDGCYYARLASLDGSDIIDNNNTDGPVVIRIKASDKAFQVKRCGTFTRIGD